MRACVCVCVCVCDGEGACMILYDADSYFGLVCQVSGFIIASISATEKQSVILFFWFNFSLNFYLKFSDSPF